VEHGAIRAPQLDSPVAGALTADGVAAVRAVTGAGTGLDAELHCPAHAITLIPAVLNRGGGCGLYLRVEEHRPGRNLTVRSRASPVPEGGAELRRHHRGHHGRVCGRPWPGANRVGLGSCGLCGLRRVLRWRERLGRRSCWPRGRSLLRWSFRGSQRRLGLLNRTAPGAGHRKNRDQ